MYWWKNIMGQCMKVVVIQCLVVYIECVRCMEMMEFFIVYEFFCGDYKIVRIEQMFDQFEMDDQVEDFVIIGSKFFGIGSMECEVVVFVFSDG